MVITAILWSLTALAALIVVLILFYKFIFLRDPEREIPFGDNIVAPADGKIIRIMALKGIGSLEINKQAIGRIKTMVPKNCRDGYLINIMMNLFNVHVQRAPAGGVVAGVHYVKGKFRNVVYGDIFKNAMENERNEITIESKKLGKIKVIQIAGIVARRIKCFVKKNQKINKGERIGIIKLGSQVSLILPERVKLLVKDGDKVRAGETILAEY